MTKHFFEFERVMLQSLFERGNGYDKSVLKVIYGNPGVEAKRIILIVTSVGDV